MTKQGNKLQIETPLDIDFQFIAHYDDGTELVQNYGSTEEKNFGHIDQDKLEVFELTNGKQSYKLNIKTGEFDLNGLVVRFKNRDIPNTKRSFLEPESDQEKSKDPDLRLVYFRRIRVDFTPEGQVNRVRHVFGWQSTVEGVNHQRLVMIEFDGSLTILNRK